MNLSTIQTEEINPRTRHIDTLSTLEMVTLINDEDHKVAEAVKAELPNIAAAVDVIAEKMRHGGRLIYVGAGTSGRLGVLDAAECPPTYSTEEDQVVGLIAGGHDAMFEAVEGAEDDRELGQKDLVGIGFTNSDVLVGIAASGRTPYVVGAMEYAKSVGASVIGLCCCTASELSQFADITIAPLPGGEVIAGSTRMKSGTAQKMVLNMLSTCAMIRLGKVYGNLMVDVKASNEKLVRRCEHIVSVAAGVTEEEAAACLGKCGYRPKIAIVMLRCGLDAEAAMALLRQSGGRISEAIQNRGN